MFSQDDSDEEGCAGTGTVQDPRMRQRKYLKPE